MSELNEAAVAAYIQARDVRGVPMKVQRLTGYAPNVLTTSADVLGVIVSDAARRFSGSGDGEAISQDFRQIIILRQDLADEGFPLPVQKNDRLVLQGAIYKLDATNVDNDTRALAGAIVISVSGVS